jgi:hypothetical protein
MEPDELVEVDPATTEVDEDDASAAHVADREPTPDEERLAEEHELDADVAAAYEHANERGAAARGEGRIA